MMRTYLLDRTDELRTYGEIAAAVAYGTGGAQTIQPNFTVRLYRLDGTGVLKIAEAATEPGAEPAIPDLTRTDPLVTSSQPFTIESQRSDNADLRWRAIAGINADRRGRRRRRAPAADGGDARELPRVRASSAWWCSPPRSGSAGTRSAAPSDR